MKRVAGVCLLGLCMAALAAVDPPCLGRWEKRARDIVLCLAPPARCGPTCIVVAADAKSRREVGPWPWPGGTAGRLVERVARGRPRGIGIVSCPAASGEERECAESVRRAGNVAAGYTLAFGSRTAPGGPVPPRSSTIRYITNPWGKARGYRMPKADGTTCANILLADAAATAGFSNSPRTADRTVHETPAPLPAGEEDLVRGAPLVSSEGDAYLMSLPLALTSLALKTERVTLRVKGAAVDGIELDGRLIPTDASGMLRLRPQRAGWEPEIVSASDVLFGNADPERWTGKVVLVGESGAAPPSRVRGRLAVDAPPVFLNAEAVDAVLAGDYLRRSRLAAFFEFLLTAFFPFIAWGAFRRDARAWLEWGLLPASLVACTVAAAVLATHGQEMRPFYPALSAVVSWAAFGVLCTRRGAAVAGRP